jgi:REP element-mobilizing transposase RayT
MCTQDRTEYFGEIKNGGMILNEYGEIARQCWQWLEKQYPYIKLDEFIIMPNHTHGILLIDENGCRDRSRPVPTEGTIKIKSLSELIGAFKTISSKQIHLLGFEIFAWQRSFYDHIIQNEKSLNEIRYYIQTNPANWERDRNNQTDVFM